MSRDKIEQIESQLARISALVDDAVPAKSIDSSPKASAQKDNASPLKMGIDLGTSNIVSIVLDHENNPVAARMTAADVVRDGIVWDFFGAVSIIQAQYESLQKEISTLPTAAMTSFPPGTEPRIASNVLDAAGIDVLGVVDEPSAVAYLLNLDDVAIVDIGGGTTGVAIIKERNVVYSADEATGGHHISLTISGNQRITLEKAETLKKENGVMAWSIAKPVFEKMCDIVSNLLRHQAKVDALYLSGGSCMMPGVLELFKSEFPQYEVILPRNAIFLTPYAIAANHGRDE